MPRSFLIKPRRHKLTLKEDRIQDVTQDVYIPNCQQSPGRISEDSGIEDMDPFMSPRSTNSSEGGVFCINSPVSPPGGYLASVGSSALERVGYHGNKQMPQLVSVMADADDDAARKMEAEVALVSPASATPVASLMGLASPQHSPPADRTNRVHHDSPSPPLPRDPNRTSLRHSRPIKDLPLIKRPFAYQEEGLQEAPCQEMPHQNFQENSNETCHQTGSGIFHHDNFQENSHQHQASPPNTIVTKSIKPTNLREPDLTILTPRQRPTLSEKPHYQQEYPQFEPQRHFQGNLSPKSYEVNFGDEDITNTKVTTLPSHNSHNSHNSHSSSGYSAYPLNLVTKSLDLTVTNDLVDRRSPQSPREGDSPKDSSKGSNSSMHLISPSYDNYSKDMDLSVLSPPMCQRQSVIRDMTVSTPRSYADRELTNKVKEIRPMTSSTPRTKASFDENKRPQTTRAAPYHIPSKHYFTDITRIASERSHNYVSITKGQEVTSSAQRSQSSLTPMTLNDERRSASQKNQVKNVSITSSPESTNKRPEVFVTSSHYTVLTPRRSSANHLKVLQENKDENMKYIPRRPLQQLYSPTSPNHDVENQPMVMFQDGHQNGGYDEQVFQDGGQENLRRDISRFKCEDCGKSYATFSGLTKHKQFHCTAMFKKEFSCKYCSKTYVSLGALKMHIRTHTLPCKCPLCGKAFSRPWLLQGHIRTHTGEKPFSCQHCQRSFADRSNLRAHLQTHADIKKYNCKRCPKTFSRMSLLLKHEDGGCTNNAIASH